MHIDLDDPISKHIRGECVALRQDLTVGEALEELRRRQLPEKVVYLYAVDAEQRLTGVIPTRRILMSATTTTLDALSVKKVISIPDHATVMDACEFFITHKFLAFPVLDRERRLLGTIDVGLFTDEMQAVSERAAFDEVFQLIGVQLEQGRSQSVIGQFRARFPWLLGNICGGVLCAFLSGLFQDLLEAIIVLALFIPVVLALSESVSMQAMTITLQTLHGTTASMRSIITAVRRELGVAILLGLTCGLLVALVAWFWKHDARVAGVIAISISLSVVTACILGVLLPTTVRALGRDPRLASGPVVLALGDVATLIFYFNLANHLLPRVAVASS